MRNLCLNMMVCNDAMIIEDTLHKLLEKIPQIDYHVIVDQGSTDDTIEKVRAFFHRTGIPGEIQIRDEFCSRTDAIRYASGKSRFLLWFDAGDEVVGDIVIPDLSTASEDAFFVQCTPEKEREIRIINNHKDWEFDYDLISCRDDAVVSVINGDYHIAVSEKSARRSAQFLVDALVDRSAPPFVFRCARHYDMAGDKTESEEWYKKALAVACTDQEKYWSCLRLFHILTASSRCEEGVYYLIQSFVYDTSRYECMYELIRHYCCRGQEKTAWLYYSLIRDDYETHFVDRPKDESKRFMREWYGAFGLPYMVIIASINTQNHDTTLKMYDIIFEKKYPETDDYFLGCLFANFGFIRDRADNDFMIRFQGYLKFLSGTSAPLYKYQDVLMKYGFRNHDDDVCIRSKNILIYTGYAPVLWNYTFYRQNGMGGSETMAVQLALHLAKKWNVILVGNVEEEQVGRLRFVHQDRASDLIRDTPFHTVIVSRFLDFFMHHVYRSHQTFLWAHDTYFHGQEILNTIQDQVDACICLTEWHKELYKNQYPGLAEKLVIVPNAIDETHIVPSDTITNRFIYSSCTERGLDRVVELWGAISQEMPGSELYVCTYNPFPRNQKEADLHERMMQHKDIHIMGRLTKQELYNLMASSEYWFYPTGWSETSCITAMEMMAHGVLCMYYPVAGLCDTIGEGNGLILRPGHELDEISSLTPQRKEQILASAYKKAESFFWRTRSTQWGTLIGKRLAIFNSFSFHHEVCGFILWYASQHGYSVDMFCTSENDCGWIDYYRSIFSFRVLDPRYYRDDGMYDWVFLITDDDPMFQHRWIRDNVICINHTNQVRRFNCRHYLNCGPFRNSPFPFAFHAYPMVEVKDKRPRVNHVAIVGSYIGIDVEIINRLRSKNGEKITLHIFSRVLDDCMLRRLDRERFDVIIRKNTPTRDLLAHLMETPYILVHTNRCTNRDLVKSMSGSVGLAISTLTKPIVSRNSNRLLKLQECIEFDLLDASQEIVLDEVDIRRLEKQRTECMQSFQAFMDTISGTPSTIPRVIYQTWETKDFEPAFQEIVDSWKRLNPDYDIHLSDKHDRERFILENFEYDVYDAYTKILPEAFRADLWRYCVLYTHGGFYADIDTLCISPIRALIRDEDFITTVDLNTNPHEGQHNLSNAFIGSVARHPILRICIDQIVDHIRKNHVPSSRLDFSGPGVLGRAVNIFLGRPEDASFVGKEGLLPENIRLLHFQPGTEHVGDGETVLFQNKNGNPDIIRLYNNEVSRIPHRTVSWLACGDPIRHENIALMICGQFRSFQKNLRKNIESLRCMFENNHVHVFILSDKNEDGNYSISNEAEIVRVLRDEFGFHIGFIRYVDDMNDMEDRVKTQFFDVVQHRRGIGNNFVPVLMYRKTMLNTLKKEYAQKMGIVFHRNVMLRAFDIVIKPVMLAVDIRRYLQREDVLYSSIDTIYIGSDEMMDRILHIPRVFHDDIWENTGFCRFAEKEESCLARLRHTYAPEIQYLAQIYFEKIPFLNIRIDPNNEWTEYNQSLPFFVSLDMHRKPNLLFHSGRKDSP